MTFVLQIRQHPVRILKTLGLYLAFLGLGLNAAMIGPTLLDLQIAVSSTFDEISYIIPSRSGGYAIGALIISVLYIYSNPLLSGVLCLGLSSCLLVFAPWNRTLYGLIGTLSVNGMLMGILDVGSNMFILNLWGKENVPFMQALHFSYGLGATISPLIAKPFLLERSDNETINLNTTSSLSNITSSLDNVTTVQSFTNFSPDDIQITYAYAIIAAVQAFASIAFVVLFVFYRHNTAHPSRNEVDEHGNSTAVRVHPRTRIAVFLLSALFMGLYVGLELAMGTLLTTFVVKSDLHLEKATGALISSTYWLTFTFFRLFAVFYIGLGYVTVAKNIYYSLALILASNVFLLPFGDKYEVCLWIGVILMGFGTSSVWASVFGYLEEFFPVTNAMTATFTVSACIGEFILPFVMGNFMESHPRVFLYVTFACSASCCIVFAFIVYLCKFKLVLQEPTSSSTLNGDLVITSQEVGKDSVISMHEKSTKRIDQVDETELSSKY